MEKSKFISFSAILCVLISACTPKPEPAPNTSLALETLAPTPPLGWNSYDAYDWRINEAEFKEQVDFMEKNLLTHGYEYAVVDYLWHIVDTLGEKPILDRPYRARKLQYSGEGALLDPICMDEFGRVTPDTIRFPSARNGQGFKPLADYVHSKGMKFGIHIMRGIPRLASWNNCTIKGTSLSTRTISEPYDTCFWENSMYGVNFAATGAQEYYNSLIELYASWGVDFIKADDIMFPEFHREEIKMIHQAILTVGRPIVLSLSLGEPQIFHGQLLAENANMWRISGDFWDNWDQIIRQMDLINFWSNYTKPGNWPDADMLPIGHLSLAGHHGQTRMSKLTWPEHYTLMSLWAMAKSPLMIGGNLTTSPDSTLLFLTNDEVLYVNQHSKNGHRVYAAFGAESEIWMAEDGNSEDFFLALFNKANKEQEVIFPLEQEYLRGKYRFRDLWQHKELGVFEGHFGVVLPAHGAALVRGTRE